MPKFDKSMIVKGMMIHGGPCGTEYMMLEDDGALVRNRTAPTSYERIVASCFLPGHRHQSRTGAARLGIGLRSLFAWTI